MLFLGHIAVSLVAADATGSDRVAAVAGNLVPDVVDKTGGWVLRVFPGGRWLAHGLPFFGVSVLATRLLLDERRWRGFALGYLGHLVGDLYGGGRVPWLAPFGRVGSRGMPKHLVTPSTLVSEAAGALIIGWRLRSRQ